MSKPVLESSLAAETRHEQWMKEFGRTYADDAEKKKRFKIFAEKLEYIENFNRDRNVTYELGLNKYSDLTDEEYVAKYSCIKFQSKREYSTLLNVSEISTTNPSIKKRKRIPDSVDWRQSGAVTNVKDQGECGNN